MARSYTHIKQYYEEMEQMHQEGHSCREIGEKFGFTKEQKNAGRKQQTKLKFSYKEQREFETIDADIAALEDAIAEVETQINRAGSNYTRLQELSAERERLTASLDEKMERWVYLNDLAEKIEAQT